MLMLMHVHREGHLEQGQLRFYLPPIRLRGGGQGDNEARDGIVRKRNRSLLPNGFLLSAIC